MEAQLRDLCKVMHPTAFVPCIAQLYEHLCDFLYRHQFLSSWHSQRLEAEISPSAGNYHIITREGDPPNLGGPISRDIAILSLRYPVSRDTFQGRSAVPQIGAITPPLALSFTQAHLCDTPFCYVSRDNCAIPH